MVLPLVTFCCSSAQETVRVTVLFLFLVPGVQPLDVGRVNRVPFICALLHYNSYGMLSMCFTMYKYTKLVGVPNYHLTYVLPLKNR